MSLRSSLDYDIDGLVVKLNSLSDQQRLGIVGKNPRWSMMCAMAIKMSDEKKNTHLENAEKFLSSL